MSVCAADRHVRLDEKLSSLQHGHVNVCIGLLIIYIIHATQHNAFAGWWHPRHSKCEKRHVMTL